MREFFVNLFSMERGSEITLFSGWHFMYIIAILGLTLLLGILFKKKSDRAKKILLSVLAYCVIGVYIADFFIMPLATGTLGANGGIDVDKLPFHICTLLSFFVGFAQFNPKFAKVKDAIVALAIISSLMYITYPGSALGGVTVFSYKVTQTFAYHGLLFAWGTLSLALNAVEFNWKTIWKPLVGLVIIALWASFGNAVYSSADHHYDWFFVTGSTFGMSPYLMPLLVICATFAMVAIIYAINHVSRIVARKIAIKKQQKTQTTEEKA